MMTSEVGAFLLGAMAGCTAGVLLAALLAMARRSEE